MPRLNEPVILFVVVLAFCSRFLQTLIVMFRARSRTQCLFDVFRGYLSVGSLAQCACRSMYLSLVSVVGAFLLFCSVLSCCTIREIAPSSSHIGRKRAWECNAILCRKRPVDNHDFPIQHKGVHALTTVHNERKRARSCQIREACPSNNFMPRSAPSNRTNAQHPPTA